MTAAGPALGARMAWAANRLWMESANLKAHRFGGKRAHHWYALEAATRLFDLGLRCVGLHDRGHRNALDIAVRRLDHPLPRLPTRFDGFTVLQLSDLHLDGMPELVDRIVDLVTSERVDLCVLTGDYRTALHGPFDEVMRAMRRVVAAVDSAHGVIGILGNHDGCHMVAPLEDMGVRMLVNEHLIIDRDRDRLTIVGTDDVHYYYTDQALIALDVARSAAFTLALIHSPELYEEAAERGVDLYLCGHTHAGQICLPGGVPVITHLHKGRQYLRGVWQHGAMRGITHAGTGTSGIPIRFNTRGEILIHRLRAG